MIAIWLALWPVTGAPALQASAAPTAQRFDVASIKPCASDDQAPGPGRGLAGGTNAAISPGQFNGDFITCVLTLPIAR
jgi:hypothetical protein